MRMIPTLLKMIEIDVGIQLVMEKDDLIKPIKTNYGYLKQEDVSGLTAPVQIGRFIICTISIFIVIVFSYTISVYTIIILDTYPNRADLL